MVFAVLSNFSLSMQGTIMDLECTNAHVRNFQLNGRPPNFSTTSAKCFIHEAENLFKARWHQSPEDQLSTAMDSFQAVSSKIADVVSGNSASSYDTVIVRVEYIG
jgi:hypothetical protein